MLGALLPFALLLLALAGAPLAFPDRWGKNHTKALVVGALALPAVAHVLVSRGGAHELGRAARDYVSFLAYMSAFFVVASGVRIRLAARATPASNALLLLAGSVLASAIGTAGASVLLARPLLESNRGRPDRALPVVFFIFLVSNGGGLLSPLGDPPLYLGYLRGVPFLWPLVNLYPVWLAFVGLGLAAYLGIARWRLARGTTTPTTTDVPSGESGAAPASPSFSGGGHVLLLGLVVLASFASDWLGAWWASPLAFALVAVASLALAPPRSRDGFSWHPLVEVAVVFFGVFATLAPVLALLDEQGKDLPELGARGTFLVAGGLSSVLDNAPTYLVLLEAARAHAAGGATVGATGVGAPLLAAISSGCVLMGANTYIGNGPNLLVRSLAEEAGVPMPGFFRYSALALAVLGPIYALLALVFFAG